MQNNENSKNQLKKRIGNPIEIWARDLNRLSQKTLSK